MDVPRLAEHVSYALRDASSHNILLHLALLQVVHVDVNSICASIQLPSLTRSRLSSRTFTEHASSTQMTRHIAEKARSC
jgi:hypothetical protein